MALNSRKVITFIAGLCIFLVTNGYAVADTTTPSQIGRILKQLEILEQAPGNLSPQQHQAIQNIRNIIRQRPEKIASPPPRMSSNRVNGK